MAFVMPLFVACSTFGSVNGGIFASSRLFFVGARGGLMPKSMALINVHTLTPMPCLIFLVRSKYSELSRVLIFGHLQGIISLAMLMTDDLYDLINYTSFVESLFQLVSVTGLLYLRWKEPDRERPIKVTNTNHNLEDGCLSYTFQVCLLYPLTFFVVCGFLVVFPVYVSPELVGVDIVILIVGVLFYLVFIRWTNKPEVFKKVLSKPT